MIRRPLPSLGLGGAAPGITVGVRHGPLKASKAPHQLSKAFEPQNPPQQLAKAPRLLCHGTSL